MTNSAGTVVDPGVDPVDPVTVLRVLREGLAAAEGAIIRFQALRDAQLAAAQRVAEELAARDAGGAVRGESVEIVARSVAAELAGVLHMSDRVVQGRIARAADLATRFPAAMRAFGEARINAAHVRVIQDAGTRLDNDTVRAEFEQIAVAASEGETPHRAKRIIERVAERLAPRSLTDRHRDAQVDRRVWREDLGDGQKALGVIHSAAIIDGIYDRLTQQARAVSVANAQAKKDARSPDPGGLGDPGDGRTMDQLRADLCADTLLTGAASGHDTAAGLLSAIQARVEITVPVLTLMGSDADADAGAGSGTRSGTAFGVRTEQPGELAGGQPIDTHTARILAGGATAWERVLTHPVTGAILAVDHYRPNTDLRASCTQETPGAGSRPADSHPAPKTSTTPSTPPTADPPKKATSTDSADTTTSSNTTPPGQ